MKNETGPSSNPDGVGILFADTYTAEQLSVLTGGEVDAFRSDAYQLSWRPGEKHVLLFQKGLLVSHVGLLAHAVEVDGLPIRVCGVGGVITRPEYRGRGFGVTALDAAQEFASEHFHVRFMLLFCNREKRSWYESHGWQLVPGPVLIDQPKGTIPAPLLVMVKPLGPETWPAGELRLQSLPW